MHLQALRADFLHHALHRRVDGADRRVAGLQIRREQAVPCLRDGRHHAVRTDRNHAVDLVQRNLRSAELALAVGIERLDDVADVGPVACARGAKPGASSRSTTQSRRPRARFRRPCSGRSTACSRRNRRTRLPAARSAWPIENSTALPSPPPTSSTVSPAGVSVGCPVGPIRMTGSPGCELRAEIGRAAHLQRDHRDQPALADRPRRRSAPDPPSPSTVSAAARRIAFRNSAAGRTGRA